MSKMTLTESQARRAIRKWLFEYATDSGVSHRASTDDKIAGKLGDDREDQPASTIPQEIPIIATSQMSTQLTQDMPPIEDPNFIPGTVEELGRSADLVAQVVPHSEIEWFYDRIQELAEEAVDKAAVADLAPLDGLEDSPIESQVRPSQRASQEAAEQTNEAWNRWSKLLSNSLTEAGKRWKRADDFAYRWKQGDRLDLYRPKDEDDLDRDFDDAVDDEDEPSPGGPSGMTGTVDDGGVYRPSQEDLEDMAGEFDADIDDLFGFDPRRHKTAAERQADLASGEFDGDAKLRELVGLGIYPQIRTMSGMRKKIRAEIDPIVQMWATANPAFDWLMGWLDDKYQLNWDGQEIAGPDVYEMAIHAYEKFYRKQPNKLGQLADAIEDGEFYKEAMAEIVLAPIIRKWVSEVKKGNIDVSTRKAKNNLVMSDWILEVVLNKGFGKSGPKRRAQKLDAAMGGLDEFKQAMAVVQQNAAIDMSEEE